MVIWAKPRLGVNQDVEGHIFSAVDLLSSNLCICIQMLGLDRPKGLPVKKAKLAMGSCCTSTMKF